MATFHRSQTSCHYFGHSLYLKLKKLTNDLYRKDLQALTLVRPTGTSPVLDPLAVLCLSNQLFVYFKMEYFKVKLNFIKKYHYQM